MCDIEYTSGGLNTPRHSQPLQGVILEYSNPRGDNVSLEHPSFKSGLSREYYALLQNRIQWNGCLALFRLSLEKACPLTRKLVLEAGGNLQACAHLLTA